MDDINFQHLNVLLKAPSKQMVIQLCQEAVLHRNHGTFPDDVVKTTAQSLDTSPQESKHLLAALSGLMKAALYKGSSDMTEVVQLFPADFHQNLRDLLAKIIIDNLARWQAKALSTMVSLPRLVDFDWSVDTKMSGDAHHQVSLPTCLLQIQIEDPAERVGQDPSSSRYNVEMSKETLNTMLDGLGKIRDQLNSVAQRT